MVNPIVILAQSIDQKQISILFASKACNFIQRVRVPFRFFLTGCGCCRINSSTGKGGFKCQGYAEMQFCDGTKFWLVKLKWQTEVPGENVKVQFALPSVLRRLALKTTFLQTFRFGYIAKDTDYVQTSVQIRLYNLNWFILSFQLPSRV